MRQLGSNQRGVLRALTDRPFQDLVYGTRSLTQHICESLERRGLVAYSNDEYRYFITDAGRAAIAPEEP